MMEDGDKRGITVADEIRIVVVVVDWFEQTKCTVTARRQPQTAVPHSDLLSVGGFFAISLSSDHAW